MNPVTVYRSNLGWNIHIDNLDEGWLHATPKAAAAHLQQLKEDGYEIPQSVIDRLREEAP